MKIKISNFRNITDLELDIPDGKVSFIYGISGAGKSSLVKALSREPNDGDVPVGHPNSQMGIAIDGSRPSYEDVRVYDEDAVRSFILQPVENESAYHCLVGDETEFERKECEYKLLLKDLLVLLPSMNELSKKVTGLLTAFGQRGADGAFNKSDGIEKVKKEIAGKAPGTARSLLMKDSKYLKFIKDGTKLPQYTDGKCPFCARKLTPAAIRRVEDVSGATQSVFKIVFDNKEILKDLGIEEPVWTSKRSVSQFERALDECVILLRALETVIQFSKAADGSINLYNPPKQLPTPPVLFRVMPDLEKPIKAINENISQYRALIVDMKTQFAKLVGGKTTELNKLIKRMGIPYVIRASKLDRANKNVTYRIQHVADTIEANSGEMLSTGEKNVLALLFFMENRDGKILLFDDPVSSYDGYRKSQLYKMIMSCEGKTIIVCSHDQSFVKQAVIDRETGKSSSGNLGRTVMLVNNHGAGMVRDITSDDFGSLRGFVLEHLQAGEGFSFYRKAINVRLLCEFDGYRRKGDKKKAAWGYTSAILHGKPRHEIVSDLRRRGFSEDDIIELIEREFGVQIEPVPEMYGISVDPSYTIFEKVLVGREVGGVDKVSKSILNDIVHFNNSLAICLNPYVYADYPGYIADMVEGVLRSVSQPC